MTNTHSNLTGITRRRFSAVLAALGAATIGRSVVAQESTPDTVASPEPAVTPQATPAAAAEKSVTTLISAEVEKLPEAPFTVRLLRIQMEAGTINPFHTHHGPEIAIIEIGEMVVKSQGTAFITRANGTQEELTDDQTTLAAGDTIHYPAEVAMYYENATKETNVMLNAVAIPVGPDYANERITYLEGKPDLTGLSYQKLGDGLIQTLDQQAAMWTVDLIALPAREELPGIEGIGMVTPLEGNLSFRIDSGQVQVTRHDSNMLQPNAVLGSGFSLADGDAAFFPNGFEAAARDDEANPLTYLGMTITPENGVPEAPAVITFTAGDGTVAKGQPADPTGTLVTTNTDGVNMRVEPSVEADIVDQINEGVELEVVGGPVEDEQYTWYEVRVNAEDGSQGWMVSEFLDGLDGTQGTAAETPTPEAEPSGTPKADTGDFPVGTVLVTTEEDVRVRPEPNTNEEAITALPLGTEVTVTGEPIEADGYTWLPIESADGWIGYVVTDFVEEKKD